MILGVVINMKNYENFTEVGRGEGLTEGELRTMGTFSRESD